MARELFKTFVSATLMLIALAVGAAWIFVLSSRSTWRSTIERPQMLGHSSFLASRRDGGPLCMIGRCFNMAGRIFVRRP
jgi:hypothetical protein